MFEPDKYAEPETSRNTGDFQKHKNGNHSVFLVIWDKKFSTSLVTPPDDFSKFCRQTE